MILIIYIYTFGEATSAHKQKCVTTEKIEKKFCFANSAENKVQASKAY